MNPILQAIFCVIVATAVCGCDSGWDEVRNSAQARNYAKVQQLLQSHPKVVRRVDSDGDTLLNLAVEADDVRLAKLLIDAGADVHHHSPRTGLPLLYASFFGRSEMVEMLLKSGCDPNRQPPRGVTTTFNGGALHQAVFGGKLKSTLLLLNGGADIHLRDDRDGCTPLFQAANPVPPSEDRAAIAELLLSRGANVNATDNQGRTPLYWAEYWKGPQAVIDVLIKHGGKRGE